MWGVSQHYLDTLQRSHTQLVYVEIIKDGVSVGLVQGGFIDKDTGDSLFAIDGSVSVSKTTIRRSGSVNFLNPGGKLIPNSTDDLLAPYVTELRIWIGVRYWDSPFGIDYTSQSSGQLVAGVPQTDTEYVPVATLVITDIDTSNFPQIQCQGYDRMWLLANFPEPVTVAAGTDVGTAILNLLTANMPGSRLFTNFPSVTYTVPATTFDADTPIPDACLQLAQSAGLQFYADQMGVFQLTPEPTTDSMALLTLQPAPRTNIMRPHRLLGEGVGQMYNAVIFTGEGGNTSPVRGYAEDDDATSSTYVGRVGVRPYFTSSPLISDTNSANQAALTTLKAILGVSSQLIVPILPNHAFDSGDVVHVTDSAQGIDENAIIDSFIVPLRASSGQMDLTCRVRVISQ